MFFTFCFCFVVFHGISVLCPFKYTSDLQFYFEYKISQHMPSKNKLIYTCDKQHVSTSINMSAVVL